jgi:hypothetical protein
MLLLRSHKGFTQGGHEECACERKRLRISLAKLMLRSFSSKNAVCKIDALMGVLMFCAIENMFGYCLLRQLQVKMALRKLFNRYLAAKKANVELAMKFVGPPEVLEQDVLCHLELSEDCDDMWSIGLNFACTTARYQRWLYYLPHSPSQQPVMLFLHLLEYLQIKGARHTDNGVANFINHVKHIYGLKSLGGDATCNDLLQSWKAHSKVTTQKNSSSGLTTSLISRGVASSIQDPSKCLLSTLIVNDFGIDHDLINMTPKDIESDVETCLDRINKALEQQLSYTPLVWSLLVMADACRSPLCLTMRSGELLPKWDISRDEAQAERKRLSTAVQHALHDVEYPTRMAVPR